MSCRWLMTYVRRLRSPRPLAMSHHTHGAPADGTADSATLSMAYLLDHYFVDREPLGERLGGPVAPCPAAD